MGDGLYSERRLIYEMIDDETLDEFGRRFVDVYLSALRSRRDAIRLGLMDAKLRHADAGPITWDEMNECKSRLMVTSRQACVIELRHSYLKNAKYATAAGKYHIKGLTLKWDTAIWSLLREVEQSPQANPLIYPSATKYTELLAGLEFRPEASEIARSICRVMVIGHYALDSIYSYTNRGSLSRYLRSSCDFVCDIYDKLERVSEILPERRERRLIEAILPTSVCRCMGLSYERVGRSAFFRRDYVMYAEHAMEMLYDAFCECDECRERRFERLSDAVHVGVGRTRKCAPSRIPRFEKRYVRVANYPELGALSLPKIRHLNEVQQEDVCRWLEKDLIFSNREGRVHFGLPLPFGGSSCADVDHEYVLFLAANVTFLVFVVRTLYVIIRFQAAEYGHRLRQEVSGLANLLAGVARQAPRGLVVDPSDVRTREGYLMAAEALRRLDFSKPGGRSFFENFSGFIDVSRNIPDYQSIREARTREELLLHHLYVRRMYDDNEQPLKEFCGEDKLVPYYVFVGDRTPRTSTAVRNMAVDLSDRELCNEANRVRRWLEHARVPFAIVRVTSRNYLSDFENMYVRRYVGGEVGGCVKIDDIPDSCRDSDEETDSVGDGEEMFVESPSVSGDAESSRNNVSVGDDGDEMVSRRVYENDGRPVEDMVSGEPVFVTGFKPDRLRDGSS
uniref:Protein UL27 n=1 Tax=Lemniscomys rat herpesvirus TaxID=3141920 RepID=A0AAU7E1X1_9VIRU